MKCSAVRIKFDDPLSLTDGVAISLISAAALALEIEYDKIASVDHGAVSPLDRRLIVRVGACQYLDLVIIIPVRRFVFTILGGIIGKDENMAAVVVTAVPFNAVYGG